MGFRQLGRVPEVHGVDPDSATLEALISFISPAFYKDKPELHEPWGKWIRSWLKLLAKQGSLEGVGHRMMAVNPKYILREYMLVQAYEAAKSKDYSLLNELYQLIRTPYEEQPDMEAKYYRLAPSEALSRPGTS